MTVTIKTDLPCSDTSLPLAVRDSLLRGLPQTAGVVQGVWAFDLSHLYSWAKQAAPVEGDVVKNLAGASDGTVRVETQSSSGAIAWDNTRKAFDFSAVKRGPTGVRTPAGWLNRFASGSSNQYWLGAVYVLLPASGAWPAGVGGVNGVMTDTAGLGGPIEFFSIALVRGNSGANDRQIWGRRRTSSGVYSTNLTFLDADIPYGQWTQIGYWRNAAGSGLRLRSASGGVKLTTTATGSKTTDDLTAQSMCWGLGAGGASIGDSYSHKVPRGWIEDLEATVRDPVAVLDADWARVIARGVIG